MNNTVTAVILSVFSSGVIVAVINWLRERHKDSATVQLTDVQTLQTKLAYVEGIADNLKKHNDALQKDYDDLDQRYRTVRQRVTELEEELDKVRRSAAQTQAECESLSKRLQALMGEVNNGREDTL